jgi:crossover junction endodeoxyribonuclease RusA
MTAAISFGLPFPAKVLWPNGRPAHWAEKARAVKSARKAAWAAALAAGVKSLPASGRYAIDADNAVSSLKASLDGIADALGVDDRTFDTPSISFGEPVKGGLLSLTLTVNPQPQSGE